MRRLSFYLASGSLALVVACAPAVVPAPTVTTPRYPDFVRPVVAVSAATSVVAELQDRAWRFLQAGDLANAEREIRIALGVTPSFYPAQTLSGYVALARTDAAAALDHFDAVLEGHSEYVSALVGRGQALVALERDVEAIEAFEAAIRFDRSLTDLQRRVDVLRFRVIEREIAMAREASSAGRLEEASRAYQQAIASSPESAFLYRELALIESELGETDAAFGNFQRAVELDGFDAAALAGLAQILESRGELDEALATYDRSLAIDRAPPVAARRESLRARLEFLALPEEYRTIESSPELTRADLAALIGVRFEQQLPAAQSGAAVVITDVRNSWAEPWVMAVAAAGVMDPFDNHTFQPGSLVRRVDLAQAIQRLLDRIGQASGRSWDGGGTEFSDVARGHLAYPAASVAVASGVMRVGPNGAFEPARVVTGVEAIAAFDRLEVLSAGTLGGGAGRP